MPNRTNIGGDGSSSAADRLRAMREGLSFTQIQAAAIIGVHVTTYQQYENSRRRPTLEQLHRFATSLGGDPSLLDPRLAPNGRVGR